MIHCPGKCILSGEHTVLRSGMALVTPVQTYGTSLTYQESSARLRIGNPEPIYHDLLALLTEQALLSQDASGILDIRSTIPPASGLGSSAALCVTITKFLVQQGYLTAEKIFKTAQLCEDLFHEKSSGLDIAGVMATGLVCYQMNQRPIICTPSWQPLLYLSDSGYPSHTDQAVSQVMAYNQNYPPPKTDSLMAEATQTILDALTSTHGTTRLGNLKAGIDQAALCFREWNLISPKLDTHMEALENAGAIAAKPTGAGLGGHVLSLWSDLPPNHLNLIPVSL